MVRAGPLAGCEAESRVQQEGTGGLSAPGGCFPRSRASPPEPLSPAGARLSRRQAGNPAGRGAGLPLSIHRRPAAGGRRRRRRRRRLENSGAPAPSAAARGAGMRGRPPPSGPSVVATARLGAHPGPSAAGARAEAGEARQHPLARPRAERSQPSRGAARCTVSPRAALASPGPRALQAPGGGRRPSLPAVAALSASASVVGGGRGGGGEAPGSRPGPAGGRRRSVRRSAGASCRAPGGPKLRHRAASWRRRLRGSSEWAVAGRMG